MKMREINLEDWTLSGGGMVGESYVNNADPTLMLKFYPRNHDFESAAREIEISKSLLKLGIDCPAPGELVSCKGSVGMTFRRIMNKVSICKAAGENPEQIGDLAGRLARMTLQLHKIQCTEAPFASVIDYYSGLVNSIPADSPYLDSARAALEIVKKDDRNTLIHGDFHFGNVITNGKTDYFIDLGDCRYGNPDVDITMFYFVTHFPPEQMLKYVYHIDKAGTMQFWDCFKAAYYGESVPSDEDLFSRLKPYLFLLTFVLESHRGPDELLLHVRDMTRIIQL